LCDSLGQKSEFYLNLKCSNLKSWSWSLQHVANPFQILSNLNWRAIHIHFSTAI
jgi:hypothetical protein